GGPAAREGARRGPAGPSSSGWPPLRKSAQARRPPGAGRRKYGSTPGRSACPPLRSVEAGGPVVDRGGFSQHCVRVHALVFSPAAAADPVLLTRGVLRGVT